MKISYKKLQNELLIIFDRYKNRYVFKLILKIASYIYSIAYLTRIALYNLKLLRSYSLNAKVISIGNITTGGTGKTPFAIESAKYFISLGHDVAILLRGYRGEFESTTGVLLVSDGEDILSESDICGEEAILIAKNVPKAKVLVGKDRVQTGKAAIKLGANVIILDDGYQHLRIKRDKNIVLLDSYAPFDNNSVLPAGQLREHQNSLKRATAIVLTNSDKKQISDKDLLTIKKHVKNTPIYRAGSKLTKLIGINTKKEITINDAKKMKAFAFCGIGNPNSFVDSLKRSEISIVSHLFFPDHHDYEYSHIQQIVTLAQKYGVEDIITTEKDAIKLDELCLAAPANFWYTKHELTWNDLGLLEQLFN